MIKISYNKIYNIYIKYLNKTENDARREYQPPCALASTRLATLLPCAFPVSTPRIRRGVNASSFPRSLFLRLSDPAAMARNPGCTVFIGEISPPPRALPSFSTAQGPSRRLAGTVR